MKLRNIALIATIATVSALLGGCASDETAHKKTTVFGIFTSEPESFASRDVAAFPLRTEEAFGMELPSGDRLTFLWGLVSLEDY